MTDAEHALVNWLRGCDMEDPFYEVGQRVFVDAGAQARIVGVQDSEADRYIIRFLEPPQAPGASGQPLYSTGQGTYYCPVERLFTAPVPTPPEPSRRWRVEKVMVFKIWAPTKTITIVEQTIIEGR